MYTYDKCRRKRYNLPVRERPEEGFRHCRTKLAQPMDGEISAWYVWHVGHVGHCRTLKNIEGHKSWQMEKYQQDKFVTPSGLHKLWYPSIRDTSTWSNFRAHGEHGDVFLFSNLGALWFSENLIRYSLHLCLREGVKKKSTFFRKKS